MMLNFEYTAKTLFNTSFIVDSQNDPQIGTNQRQM